MRKAALAVAALALLAGPAAAQIVPGLPAPTSPADAVSDAQAMLCTLAAAGRPMPGLNSALLGGEGMTALDALPDSLARFVGREPQQRIVQLVAPGDPVWVVHDPRSRRCAIITLTDPAPVTGKLLASLDLPGAWERVDDAGGGIDYAYEWEIDKSVRLRTEVAIPDAFGEPLIVVVRPANR